MVNMHDYMRPASGNTGLNTRLERPVTCPTLPKTVTGVQEGLRVKVCGKALER